MAIWNRGDEFYYFIYYDREEVGLAKVRVERSYAGLFPPLRILKIYTPKTWLGYKASENEIVSANELLGVGSLGPKKYIFTKEKLFEEIFKGL